jgi:hypothetical protein
VSARSDKHIPVVLDIDALKTILNQVSDKLFFGVALKVEVTSTNNYTLVHVLASFGFNSGGE